MEPINRSVYIGKANPFGIPFHYCWVESELLFLMGGSKDIAKAGGNYCTGNDVTPVVIV